ncbi:FMN-binding negative transcriptional regulator [Halotalea alkalilenta]|uniref:FMN-binding negative transcriptional regulator n=1 Tax=Halotalea alkalilenta TaxID=376489 RepID=UPI0005BA5C46|nr:FMN-binding negative transcriptional regulator [Halotalea alkalilenta]
MYRPRLFDEHTEPTQLAMMSESPFAMLIVMLDGRCHIDHLPLLVDALPQGGVHVVGHIARANPLWQACADAPEGSSWPATAVFHGPHHYISPRWYPSKAARGEAVPTWNYSAVHLHGRVRFFTSPSRLRKLLEALASRFEAPLAGTPWRIEDAPARYIDAMLEAIAGFEFEPEQIEAKRKASQNRPAADRQGVREGLAGLGLAPSVIERLVTDPDTINDSP